MATRKSGPLDAMVGARIQYVAGQPRHEPDHARGTHRRYLSTDAEIRAGRQPGWREPVVANRFRAGCFGRRVVRIFPGRTSRLEFAGSLACRAGRLARSQGLCANDQSASCGSCIAKLVESIASRTPGAKATVALFESLSIVMSGGSFPREDSLPQEDERQSRAARNPVGGVSRSRESQAAPAACCRE